ncbi:MAG: hypothetical protein DRI84_09675 [Bacteroidetes bacterium]|nr:MAG: hypothetical protein DRI84_09675 [Bacteroidota bacterium]
MLHSNILANRGTKSDKPSEETPVVGESFKEAEQERLEESGVTNISVNRGTSTIPVEDTVTEKRKEYEGKKSTHRGTSSE